MPELLKKIEAIVGQIGIIKGDEVRERIARWGANDKMAADAIVRPASTHELSQVMTLCFDADQAVLPLGGNTGLTGVASAGVGEIFLSLERMNNIEAVNEIESTITVDAGATLQRVQEAAEVAGFLYPIDLGARGSCTIGGTLATNAGGNEVIRYGMTREQVLGIEVVLADGSIITNMKSLIKNNTGYDLKQIFIGSEGTLGVITRAVLRLRPKPKSRNTAFLAADSFDDVMNLLAAAKSQFGSTLSSFEVMWKSFYDFMSTDPNLVLPKMDSPHPYYVLLEATGFNPEIDDACFIDILEGLFEIND
ncbi:MAG: FAD-binding oxidoreductase, partial [Gammaproteobacteria bacterium]|nr:FAD-binding oxidoreductase [Gammaproteobacteria bacterium]